MPNRNIEIIDDRSWKATVRHRKRLGSFQVPIVIVAQHELTNGDCVSVEFLQNNVQRLFYRERRLTSGCEILVPKSDEAKLTRVMPVEIRISGGKIPLDDSVFEDDTKESGGLEGKRKVRLHRSKERASSVVKAAKEVWKKHDPLLRCTVCGLSFAEVYGPLGIGYVEAHHLVPLSTLTKETRVTMKDFAPVCSNCHRMLHRSSSVLTLDGLRNMMRFDFKDHKP